MKIPKSRRFSKRAVAILATIVVLAAAAAVYFLWVRPSATDKDGIRVVERDGKTTVEIDDKPVGEVDYGAPSDEDANPVTDNLPTAPDPNATGTIPMSITYAGGTPLQVRVVANEILSSGTCDLRLERSGQPTISQTAETFVATSYTTCKGFSVDTTGVAKGNWNLTVTIKSGDRQGTATKEISI